MKNSSQSISLILAAGAAGVAIFALANAQFTAGLPAVTLLAIAVSIALLSLAVYDYSRRVLPLRLPVRLLRPTVPAVRTGRSSAYGNARNCQERVAA